MLVLGLGNEGQVKQNVSENDNIFFKQIYLLFKQTKQFSLVTMAVFVIIYSRTCLHRLKLHDYVTTLTDSLH